MVLQQSRRHRGRDEYGDDGLQIVGIRKPDEIPFLLSTRSVHVDRPNAQGREGES
jgi:hypothetical protein